MRNDKCGIKLGNAFILPGIFMPIIKQGSHLSEECKEAIKEHNLNNCCNIPVAELLSARPCLAKCAKDSDPYCLVCCIQEEEFVDEKFNPDKSLKRYAKEISKLSDALTDWKLVVEKSIETCHKLSS